MNTIPCTGSAWTDDNLKRLLTQFFDRLETITLDFRAGNEIRNYSRDTKYVSNVGDSKKSFELVLNCCFSSPALRLLVITDPIRDDRVEFFSTLSRKLGPSLKTINFSCQGYKTCYLEAFTNIIASHSQLTDIYFNVDRKVAASSLSCLYTSLIDFVKRPEFSKLFLNGQLPLSSHLQLLLDAFLKIPCSQPQEIHLYPFEPACSEASPFNLPVDDNNVPSGALKYKSLIFNEHSKVPVDFCEWLCSHQPLSLKTFHFDADLVKIGKYDTSGFPMQFSFPMQFLCDNALFQTQELLLPIFPSHVLQNLLQHQKLTKLSLKQPFHSQIAQESKQCNISAITSILSLQIETLTELIIPSSYHNSYVPVESSADMERFSVALFSSRNCEIFFPLHPSHLEG
jgi:hypothetical protein